MPRRILESRATPILLIAFTLSYSVGIIAYRLTVDPHAGRVWAPLMLGLFTLAYWLTCRAGRCDDLGALREENRRLRDELTRRGP